MEENPYQAPEVFETHSSSPSVSRLLLALTCYLAALFSMLLFFDWMGRSNFYAALSATVVVSLASFGLGLQLNRQRLIHVGLFLVFLVAVASVCREILLRLA